MRRSCFEPIPGYVLRERLWSWWLCEVWLADAPGGLKKAIKFVFGSLDDDRASRELKALKPNTSGHSSFLVVVRADRSHRRSAPYRDGTCGRMFARIDTSNSVSKVRFGIPRDQLLDYLRDAADALDFFVKNITCNTGRQASQYVIVADRVKVADFGLVKRRAKHSMSMMADDADLCCSEMFDGRPGRFSDQYSLPSSIKSCSPAHYPLADGQPHN